MSYFVGGVGGAILGAGIIGGIGTVAGSLISSNAAGDAAATQAAAATHAADLQYQEYQQNLQNEKPWLQAGQAALPQLSSMAANPVTFTQQDFMNNMDPAYQFDLQQGQQALERSAAARGGLMSGGTLKDLTSYAQGQASNEYQNAYNRFMNNQNMQFNRLASVAGVGQTANNQLNAAGMNMANNVGNIMTGSANAQAASQIAQGNIWGNTLSGVANGVANGYMGSQLMNRMYPQQIPSGNTNLGYPTTTSTYGLDYGQNSGASGAEYFGLSG